MESFLDNIFPPPDELEPTAPLSTRRNRKNIINDKYDMKQIQLSFRAAKKDKKEAISVGNRISDKIKNAMINA